MASQPRSCADCGHGPLGYRNTSGYCGRCIGRANMRDPKVRENMANGIRRRLQRDPELLESYKVRMREAQASPKAKAARRARWLRDEPWRLGNLAQPKGSDPRRRMARSISETRMAWCPPELRAEYHRLVDAKRIPTEEAKRIILEQHDADMARFRRSIGATK